MQLTRWNHRKDLFDFGRHVNSLWDDFFAPTRAREKEEGLWNWHPAVDIYENDDAIVVKAELPGVDKDKITVDLNANILTIRGERSSDNEVKEDNYYRRERTYGQFQRSFTLPAEVDPDAIKANYKDGVLKVEVPKPEASKPKQISVN